MKPILVVGSANMDLVVTAPRAPLPGETLLGGGFATFRGGKGANQAVAAARLGGRVALLGRVGRDDFGTAMRGGIAADGVDVSGLVALDQPSGVALIITTAEGGNSIVVAPGANGALDAAAIDATRFAGVGFVLAQLETPLDGVQRAAELAARNGALFILDPAPARALPGELLRLVDWLTPNETEAKSLLGVTGELEPVVAARALRQRGAKGVIMKLGSRGALLLGTDDVPQFVPSFPVVAIDSTAAGDTFNGAFAVALGEGAQPAEAARFAAAAAAISVTRRGAQNSMPSRQEVQTLLETR